ncbi:MAG: tRNA lysidine(34) synthetase TilS [Polyangiaceae bacterium]|nr:tRNA lysidine(34) synthetase TilS [Polyangiaceae bacterium]
MSRSHPPSLVTIVRRTLREDCRLEPRARLLLAVSGGGDSQALLDVLARLRPTFGFALFAQGVDHGLRPEARAELDHARRLALAHGIPFAVTRLAVPRGPNLQARARAARFAALRAAAHELGIPLIATAHHADDRAETVLLRLLRGSGPRGLAALPPRSEDLIRPLIRGRRREILAYLSRREIPFASDPSNEDPRFLRVRVRRELVPLLEALSPRIVDHLVVLADQLGAPMTPAPVAATLDGTTLGRAQREALARALALGLGNARIWLSGDRAARVDPRNSTIELGPAQHYPLRRRRGLSNP